ncbi:MAG: pyridoxal 5'-phosphate synthase glutaminase subunit PdxT [Anaerolineae bacterium]|nr:pyridoxal 5'-phosphate synthase glutaminase subunit PdxT [Anaerolineae bacterium]MCO5190693.1 pyridoxal 5'-phosphate synthase glutaminase subunit PdxT [Anaerolineae bacterium]MCO5195689.1 pyridoxal 5'-phosphate synthase glutaminase subunit PdxT [Anaerolineae bacterium]MCO5197530.1 pyridoxal 5'-phosphate synthase glutaminase subunit PdxT [Anaerolineae bacterium]
MKIGVLALQGAFIEHISILRRLGAEAVEVRLPLDLVGLDGLIIPGGESTTIGKLAVMYDLMEPLQTFAQTKPLWGTCAGMIFMAKDIGMDQPLLGVMDIAVERNAFGRQVDSFEIDLDIPAFHNNGQAKGTSLYHAIFIRAPKLVAVRGNAAVIATLPDGTAVAARQGTMLVTSFHPELTDDTRFHQYFLEMVAETAKERG